MPDCAQELRAFIRNNFLYGSESPEFAFGDEDSLIERGIIDSTGVMELIAFLEVRYAIVIEDDELVPDNLDSVSRVVRFVERKLQPAQQEN
jgi:acyl carrier protein